MSEEFAPFEDLYPPIVLKAFGKEYSLPVIDWAHGVDLQRRIGEATVTEVEVMQELLGEGLIAQLKADGVSGEFIARAGAVAFADWKIGREAAKQVWADPKAVARMVGALRAMVTQAEEAPAATTPTPASPSSTRSKRTRASQSSGRTS
jgi:hypothetical protein